MNIAVLGYGTVGSGVVAVIEENAAVISRNAGQDINVKYVLDLRDFPGNPIQDRIVHDYQVILNDPEIKIVVEVMGGLEPAHTFVKQALEAGKSVATSNKELVARFGSELIETAKQHDVNFFFEASVGGGIPIIRPLLNCITADHIREISGILNGTTNYMLTKMDREGVAYDEVLKEAQALGYAERNPEADVEGFDACRKIAILTSLAIGRQVDFADIYTEGITKIETEDFEYAKVLGSGIKLLGSSMMTEKGIFAKVSPVMVGNENPLAGVNDVYNAILVDGDMLDQVMFYGKGAGMRPTASAVVSDVIAAAKANGSEAITWEAEKAQILPIGQFESRFFVRAAGSFAEAEAQVKELFGDVKAIEAVEGEFAFVTDILAVDAFNEKTALLKGFIKRLFVK